MTKPNDGGNAYPTRGSTVVFFPEDSKDQFRDIAKDLERQLDGLTKREAITIAVRQAIGTWTPLFEPPRDEDGYVYAAGSPERKAAERQARAAWCVAEADAVLAELNKE